MTPESGDYIKGDNPGMNLVIIGIGSNIGPEKNIPAMLDILGSEVNIVKISKLVKTKPIGIKNQPDYINGAVKVVTGLGIDEFRSLLKKVEDRLGRDRNAPKYGPRTIDLDIVVWNGKIVNREYFSRDFLRDSVDEVSL
jgi:2-amino-4-hydroxy-6-hydroxymethyldihydropteridine diphosphokinase